MYGSCTEASRVHEPATYAVDGSESAFGRCGCCGCKSAVSENVCARRPHSAGKNPSESSRDERAAGSRVSRRVWLRTLIEVVKEARLCILLPPSISWTGSAAHRSAPVQSRRRSSLCVPRLPWRSQESRLSAMADRMRRGRGAGDVGLLAFVFAYRWVELREL